MRCSYLGGALLDTLGNTCNPRRWEVSHHTFVWSNTLVCFRVLLRTCYSLHLLPDPRSPPRRVGIKRPAVKDVYCFKPKHCTCKTVRRLGEKDQMNRHAITHWFSQPHYWGWKSVHSGSDGVGIFTSADEERCWFVKVYESDKISQRSKRGEKCLPLHAGKSIM